MNASGAVEWPRAVSVRWALRGGRAFALAAACAAFVCGCASYVPGNIADEVARVLSSSDRVALTASAAELNHPYLAPRRIEFGRALELDDIAVLAVVGNPDLRALRARMQVADAQVFDAGLLPDPSMSFGFDHVLSPSTESAALAGSLTFDALAALATRPIVRAAARANADQVRLDIAWQEWIVAGQARLLAARLGFQFQGLHVARAATASARELADSMRQAQRAGDLGRLDVAAAHSAAVDAEVREASIARDAEVTRQQVNRTLGLSVNEHIELAKAVPTSAASAGSIADLFARAVHDRLDLRALAKGYAGSELRVQRAVLGQYPRVSFTINRARDTSRVQTLGPSITLDVPVWNRNRGALATANAERDVAAKEYASRVYALRADISELVTSINDNERMGAALEHSTQDLATTSATLTAAAQRGDVATSVAVTARSNAFDHRLALIALAQSSAEARIALQVAVGMPLAAEIANASVTSSP